MTTAIAQRLGRNLASSAFAETATLIRQSAGMRNQYGEWIPGDPVSSSVTLVTAPLSGQQRQALPEGLRERNLRVFYLAEKVNAVIEGSTGQTADIIVYGGINWHARISEDWGGFYAVTAEKT